MSRLSKPRRSYGGPAMACHITFEERRLLYRLKKKDKSAPEIAELMGRHRSTIYRELERNAGQRGYRPQQAQRLADERRLASRRPHKLDDPTCIATFRTASKNFGLQSRLPAAYSATFPERRYVGCPDRPFMIGSTTDSPSGKACCVGRVGPQKREE